MRGKAVSKGQNQPLKDGGNAQEIIMEGNLDHDLTEKMSEEGQREIAGGNSRHGRKKDMTLATETEVDTLNDLEAGATEKAVSTSKRGRKKDVAKTTDAEVDKLDDIEADDAEKVVPASKHGKKKGIAKTTEAEVDKLDDNEADDAEKVVPALKHGKKKGIAKTADAVDKLSDLEADNSEKAVPVSKRGRKKDAAKITEAKVDKLDDLEAGNAEKAVPASKRGRKANKNFDVKNVDITNNTNEEASSVLKTNEAELEKKNISEDPAEDNVESKSPASEKQNDVNDPDPTNVAQASKKRSKKKAETKLQPKETDEGASNKKQTSVEQNEEEKPSDEINEDLVLSNEVSEEKDVGKRSQRKKLIKDETLEDKKLSKISNKTIPKKSERKNVKKTEIIENADEIDEISVAKVEQTSKRGRKRKNKIETISDVSEDAESQQINKRQKSRKPSSALQDSAVITKEVRIVLERQTMEKIEDLSTELESTHSEQTVSRERGRATKNKKGKQDEGKSDDDFQPTKSAKVPKKTENSKGSSKKEIPDVTALDFSSESQSSSGKSWNFKISSWNISGIRAWLEKNGLSYLHHEKPDVMCVQETKCSDDKLPESVRKVDGYHCYWLSGVKDGYSGIGLLSKEEPKSVKYGIDVPEHDDEGRVITAEYDQFYLVATYVPNAGRGLTRLDYRMKWDKDFRAYLKKLDEKKPVILCGDLNVAHEEIDLANPKTNKKNAGFSKEEREGFSSLLEEGFIDTFRHLYPDVKDAYTFWTYMMNARAKNVGWRLDYFVISKRFGENLCDNVIRKDVLGSDHCPITLFLSL